MRLEPERSSLARWLAVGLGALAVAALTFAWLFPAVVLRVARCPLRELTGLSCPTCGGTHAAVALADGRPLDAWSANPLVAGGALLFGLWVLWGVLATGVPALRRELRLGSRERRILQVAAIGAIVATWLWVNVRPWPGY